MAKFSFSAVDSLFSDKLLDAPFVPVLRICGWSPTTRYCLPESTCEGLNTLI
jgi:hypothetical protein